MTQGNSILGQEFNTRRLESVASGNFEPHIPDLPGLLFVKMNGADKGAANRAYSAKLKELFNEGGWFARALLPTYLDRQAKEAGLPTNLRTKVRAIQERLMKSIPAELDKPYDRLTDEEVQLLSPEERQARDEAIMALGKQRFEWLQSFYTEEERRTLAQMEQMENLEQHLITQTAEYQAEKHQVHTELLRCCRRLPDQEYDAKTMPPYFESIEQIEELEETVGTEPMVQLYAKWRLFKMGYDPDYFRPNRAL